MLAALVNAYLEIDKQRVIHLIKLPIETNKQITYHALYPKGNPSPLPAITQDNDIDNTVEPEIFYPNKQWDKEPAKMMPQRLADLVQHTNCSSQAAAGILQAGFSAFMRNAYMHDLE